MISLSPIASNRIQGALGSFSVKLVNPGNTQHLVISLNLTAFWLISPGTSVVVVERNVKWHFAHEDGTRYKNAKPPRKAVSVGQVFCNNPAAARILMAIYAATHCLRCAEDLLNNHNDY